MAHRINSGSWLGDLTARTMGWLPGMLADPVLFLRWRWLHRDGLRGVRTLDAGCGSGWFAIYMASLGNQVTGISFDETANSAAERRAKMLGATNAQFVLGDLRELDQFGETLGKFDQIVCFETIEHIRDDAKLVRDLTARLNPGGQLMLTTPSDDHPPLIGEEVSATEDGGHVKFGYSLQELRELFMAAGLRVVDEGRLGGWVVQKLFNATYRLVPVVGWRPAVVLTLVLRPLQVLDGPLTRLLGYPELCVRIMAELPAGDEAA
jgi:2-polyprenyl-3-methyl-5-hydroxy-6-metoxy-1,4-benzoquinol methylase